MPPVSHYRHALAQLAHLSHAMRDEHDGHSGAFEPCDLPAQPFDVGDRQGRGRFVKQQHARLPCHCLGDLELLPRRQIEFGNGSIRIHAGDFECGELLRHARAARPSIDLQPKPRRFVWQQHVLRNGQTLEKGHLLKRSLNAGRVGPFRRTEAELCVPDTDLSGVLVERVRSES